MGDWHMIFHVFFLSKMGPTCRNVVRYVDSPNFYMYHTNQNKPFEGIFMFWSYVIGTLRVFWQIRTFLRGRERNLNFGFLPKSFEVRSIDGTYSVGIVSLLTFWGNAWDGCWLECVMQYHYHDKSTEKARVWHSQAGRTCFRYSEFSEFYTLTSHYIYFLNFIDSSLSLGFGPIWNNVFASLR